MLVQMETDGLLLNRTSLSRGNCLLSIQAFQLCKFESANNCNKNVEKLEKPRCRVSLKVENEQNPAPGEIGCLSNIFKLNYFEQLQRIYIYYERMREKKNWMERFNMPNTSFMHSKAIFS